MNVKCVFVSALLAGSILSAGCAENPAENVPRAAVNTPSAPQPTVSETGTPQAFQGEVLAFVEGTEVGFVGSKVTGSHEGGFKKVDGTVTLPSENLEEAVVEINIDTTSIFTDTEKLTIHLKSEDFFAVDNYPTATFKSTSIKKTDAGYDVTGDLTLHGVTRKISFPATITLNGDALSTKAEFAINRKDFDIVYAGKPDDLIRDEVVIKFDVRAEKAS